MLLSVQSFAQGFIGVKDNAYYIQQDSSSPDPNVVSKPFMQIDPFFGKADASSFYWNHYAVKQWDGTVSPNEVINFGHNLSPGGGPVKLGVPGIGYSLESNYHPSPGVRFVESHEFYITPAGKQIRLKSYTINSENDNVDFYQSVDNSSFRNPRTAKQYFYLAGTGGSATASWQTETGNYNITALPDKSFLITGLPDASCQFTNWQSVILPGIIFSGGNNRVSANTFPENDYAYSMGNYAKRWLDVSAKTFKGERVILKSGWAAYDNIAATANIDIAGPGEEQLRLRSKFTPTGTTDKRGDIGSIAWDSNYGYIKTDLGWKRMKLERW